MENEIAAPLIWIVILNFNSAEDTVELYRLLGSWDYPHSHIQVVDNGSRPACRRQLANSIPGDHLLQNQKNHGYGKGNNIAITAALAAGADFVWILNPDIRPRSNTLSLLIESISANPGIGAIGPRICEKESPDLIYSDGGLIFPSDGYRVEHRHCGKHVAEVENPTLIPVDYVNGSALLLRVQAIREVGLFREDFFLYFEEAEWCLRAAAWGWACAIDPGAVVYHKPSAKKMVYHYYMARNHIWLSKINGRNLKQTIRRQAAKTSSSLQPFHPRTWKKSLAQVAGLLVGCLAHPQKTGWRVFHLPFSEKNPYQQNLAKALVRHQVQAYLLHYLGILTLFKYSLAYGKPDIVHFHWPSVFYLRNSRFKSAVHLFAFWAQSLMLKSLQVKFVWTVHNLHAHESALPALEWRAKRWLLRFCDHVFVHSPSQKSRLFAEYGPIAESKVKIISQGHYIDNYPNTIDKATARAHLQLDKSAFVFLFLGNIRLYKGVDDLINTFHQLPDPSLRLVIAGKPLTDSLGENIRQLASSDSRISTHCRQFEESDVQIFLNSADVVCLPFREIFNSASIVLTMSFAKPLIAPRIAAVTDHVDERMAFLYDPEEAQGLATQMMEAMKRKADLDAMGACGYERIRQNDWRQAAAQTAAVYSELKLEAVQSVGENRE